MSETWHMHYHRVISHIGINRFAQESADMLTFLQQMILFMGQPDPSRQELVLRSLLHTVDGLDVALYTNQCVSANRHYVPGFLTSV